MSTPSSLAESLRNFDEKKRRCLAYIDEVVDVVRDYETVFPPALESKPQADAVPEGDAVYQSFRLNLPNLEKVRQKILDSQLRILIAGQFKAGKSTLVNAMLGQEVLPAYSTPCTAVITEIVYGEKPRAVLSFKENITELPDDLYEGARRHIDKYRGSGNVPDLEITAESTEELGDELENYLVIPMSDKEQKEAVAESPYALCHLYWPLELCKNGALVIDSPGLNEAAARDKTTLDYVPQADMVLHVLNALQCYGKPDAEFIQRARMLGNPPMLFLVNRFDQLNNDKERKRLKEYALAQLTASSTYGQAGIFFLAAQNALDGRLRGSDDAFAQSGFADFEQKIAEIFDSERGKIKLRNIVAVCKATDDMVRLHIPSLKNVLGKSAEQLEQKLQAHQAEFDDLERRMRGVAGKCEKEIERCRNGVQQELWSFLAEFAISKMPEIVQGVDDSRINIELFSPKESTTKAVNTLGETVAQAMCDAFQKWSEERGRPLLEAQISDTIEAIEWDVRQFNERVGKLQDELYETPLFSAESAKLGDMGVVGGILGDAAVGGGIGGAVAAALAFIAARFLGVFGPVGWIASIVVTIVSALLGMGVGSSAENKVKEEFIKAAKENLLDKREELSNEIAARYAETFANKMHELQNVLKKRVENVRRPIEEALQNARQRSADLQQQAAQLDDFARRFKELSAKGEDMCAHL